MEAWAGLFHASPALYGARRSSSQATLLRAESSNCIMQVAGSLNAEALVEYFRIEGLRVIFNAALPTLRQSNYSSRPRIQKCRLFHQKSQIYIKKLNELEKLMNLIEGDQQIMSLKPPRR